MNPSASITRPRRSSTRSGWTVNPGSWIWTWGRTDNPGTSRAIARSTDSRGLAASGVASRATADIDPPRPAHRRSHGDQGLLVHVPVSERRVGHRQRLAERQPARAVEHRPHRICHETRSRGVDDVGSPSIVGRNLAAAGNSDPWAVGNACHLPAVMLGGAEVGHRSAEPGGRSHRLASVWNRVATSGEAHQAAVVDRTRHVAFGAGDEQLRLGGAPSSSRATAAGCIPWHPRAIDNLHPLVHRELAVSGGRARPATRGPAAWAPGRATRRRRSRRARRGPAHRHGSRAAAPTGGR